MKVNKKQWWEKKKKKIKNSEKHENLFAQTCTYVE